MAADNLDSPNAIKCRIFNILLKTTVTRQRNLRGAFGNLSLSRPDWFRPFRQTPAPAPAWPFPDLRLSRLTIRLSGDRNQAGRRLTITNFMPRAEEDP